MEFKVFQKEIELQSRGGGLARTVGTDDAVAVAGQELQIYMLEQPLAAKLHA